jgi:FAD/FMN-containing dehydrogenase
MNRRFDTTTFLEALRARAPGIQVDTDARTLEAKSRDYYWYSPILTEQLDGKHADVVVTPSTQEEVLAVAATCAHLRATLTVRGGGTGNYGQCVPLEGGVVLDITGLNRVLRIEPPQPTATAYGTESLGRATVQAGCLIDTLELAARAQGQETLMFPSTLKIATVGGFIAGGYAGVGSIRHGILKDTGNVTRIRVVTVEETPQIIDLLGADIQKVHHAFGTNGIITELDVALAPAQDWRHAIVTFDDSAAGYGDALRLGVAMSRRDLACRLVCTVDKRFQPYYPEFGPHFPANHHALFAMVAAPSLPLFDTLVREAGGTITLNMTEAELEAQHLPPAYECAYNHTTLQALKHDRSWTYLQLAHPMPFDPDVTVRLMDAFGDEVLMHHEFGKQFGGYVTFGLPLVSYFDRDQLYAVAQQFVDAGCTLFDPHVVTIEDGGMKVIDTAQIDFKKVADPHGLMNPGKTRGWLPEYAKP